MDLRLRGDYGFEGVRGWGFVERDKGSGLVPLPLVLVVGGVAVVTRRGVMPVRGQAGRFAGPGLR
ncbi:hypothetical protein MACH10_14130 [Thalassospira tepidiphila]|nr:hypothetical protein MACH10_14130 [Thalassospira tepidiphila]